MDTINFDLFRIEIHTNRETPIIKGNPSLKYIQDKSTDELFVKVYYDSIEIGEGIILDFYKEFVNVALNGQMDTQIKTFPFHDRTKQKFTNFGNKIYQIKYLKSPSISKKLKDSYIFEFTNAINQYIPLLKEIAKDLKLTYIPSSTQIPDDIAILLGQVSSTNIANIIDKNTQNTTESKNISDFHESMEHSQKKYIFDEAYLKANNNTQYIIIDDVMGNGSSILTALKKIYDITNKMNYFLIVVKDVKR